MTAEEQQDVLYFLKLLANETRLKLLGLIAGGERSVGELAEIAEVSEPTVSHHLAKLTEARLVSMRADGNARFYRLDPEMLNRLSRDYFTPEKVVAFAGGADAAGWERKVLSAYLEGERLTKIPDVRKKRDVVLRWLAEKFERNRRYPEREVNDVIRRHHPDVATLRRELVGARLMQRESGVYWRIPADA